MVKGIVFGLLIFVDVVCAANNTNILPDFGIEAIPRTKGIRAFGWEESGDMWTSMRTRSGIRIARNGDQGPSINVQTKVPASFLIFASTVYVPDKGSIRKFNVKGNRITELKSLEPPRGIFPQNLTIHSIQRGPLGHLYFSFSPGGGIGRYDPRKDEWDATNKGLEGGIFAFDAAGQIIAADSDTGFLFRPKAGLDYERGLINYSKKDLALSVEGKSLQPGAIAVYAGDQWQIENELSWIVYDKGAGSLRQYRESTGGLQHWRDLAKWKSGTVVSHLQNGPDGTLWFIADEVLFRLRAKGGEARERELLPRLPTDKLANVLGHSNSWHRAAALALLEQRSDLINVRGLHPHTPFPALFNNKSNSPITRIHALWALHRLHLLEEVPVEEGAKDESEIYRLWCGTLLGERGYPTGMTFQRLHKLAGDTNSAVRAAAAVAARQFISSRFLVDTQPKIMPIREVFTGGILSGLWFSAEKDRNPEFDLLFWNALKPISNFDPVHPLGFFEEDKENTNQFALWLVTQIGRQMGETDNALKQQDGLQQLAKWRVTNHRLTAAVLEGVRLGFGRRQVEPTKESLEILGEFGKSSHSHVAKPAQEILQLASMTSKR